MQRTIFRNRTPAPDNHSYLGESRCLTTLFGTPRLTQSNRNDRRTGRGSRAPVQASNPGIDLRHSPTDQRHRHIPLRPENPREACAHHAQVERTIQLQHRQ